MKVRFEGAIRGLLIVCVLLISVPSANLGAATRTNLGGLPDIAGPASQVPASVYRSAYSFAIDIGAVERQIVRTGAFAMDWPGMNRDTVPLHQMDIFLPGQQRVVWMDANGTIKRSEPINATFYQGTDPETGASVFLELAPTGVYGAVEGPHTSVSLQPAHNVTAPAGGILENVSVVQRDAVSTPSAGPVGPVTVQPKSIIGGGGGSGCPTSYSTTYCLLVQPTAEPSYRNYVSDYANRIAAAYGYAQSKWQDETDITVELYSVVALSYNYASTYNCGGSGPDEGLTNWRNVWLQYHEEQGPNAYGLFHAIDGQKSYMGCGYERNLSNSNSGNLDTHAGHAIQGKDWSSLDTYNPLQTRDLGLAVEHELTHNAGEGGHPSDSNYCHHNVMMQNVVLQCKYPYRLSSTIQKVDNFAWPKVH